MFWETPLLAKKNENSRKPCANGKTRLGNSSQPKEFQSHRQFSLPGFFFLRHESTRPSPGSKSEAHLRLLFCFFSTAEGFLVVFYYALRIFPKAGI